MSQLGKDPVTGRLVKNAVTGRLVNGGCGDCSRCDFDSEQYDVTFSGITVSTSCINNATHSAIVTSAPSANVTYRVTRLAPGGCRWEYEDTCSSCGGKDNHSGTTNCGGVTRSDTIDGVHVQLTKLDATSWDIEYWFWNGVAGNESLGMFHREAGIGGVILVPSQDCSGFSDSNGVSSPSLLGQYFLQAGHGGSVSVAPV